MTAFDAFHHARTLLAGLGEQQPPAGGVRLHEPAGPGQDHTAQEALLAGVWSALARPGALATNFRLVESGRQIDRSRWMRSRVGDGEILHTALVPAYLHSAVERGATLVISHLEALDERVMLLCEALEYLLCARAWVNCYITAGDASAFDLHSDGHDALILQLLGRKRWQVDSRAGARSLDLADDSLDRVLTPGMCLSVPRDTAHRVCGTGELTVHLTVGYEPFAELCDEARAGREPVGHLAHAAARDRAHDTEWLAARLALRPDRRAGASLRSALTGNVGPATRIRWASRFPPYITTDGEHLTVTTMGRRIRLDRRLERTIALLSRGGALTFDTLVDAADLPAADLRALVAFGARNDFLICEG
ncbi:JmjC domain-containing protein [Streptomyces sp. NPDC058682]|uniref:JmjC domain-containing protein n=1 Tax=unclassified Streptomyces TaxID=2593676 RepID=UPI00225B7DCA|nr:cupin domain-containing protein [Streptomyces sp. NBC_01214]MCX4801339.1 cupin domain-containing protein [Streptomyces sp. NBC_01214]